MNGMRSTVIILAFVMVMLPLTGCSQDTANTESQPRTPTTATDTETQPQTPNTVAAEARPQAPNTAAAEARSQTLRTATLVVAAADSLPQNQAYADYVGDGIDDQVEIQEAIDALPSGGGKVVLFEGTYLLSNSVNIRHDNITLEGNNSILKLDSGYTSVLATNASSGQNQVVVSDTSGFRIGMGVWIKDDVHFGYDSDLRTIAKIEGDVLTLNANLNESYTLTDNATITNMFHFLNINSTDTYLQPTQDKIRSISIKDIIFDGNADSVSVGGSFVVPMVYVQNTYGIDISSSTFIHSLAPAITLDDNTEGIVSNSLFEDFPLKSQQRAPEVVHLSGGDVYVNISNNIFRDINTQGIYLCQRVTGSIISNNILEGGSDPLRGIKVGATNNLDNLIQGNIIKSFQIGIEDMGVRTTIADNIILNMAGQGIYTHDGNSSLISGNSISNIGYVGIEILSSHNLITNNRVEGSGQIGDGYGGIRLQHEASFNTISSNLIRSGSYSKVPGYGIWLKHPSTSNNLVINNDLYDSGTVPLRDDGDNNIIINNRGYDF